MKIRPCPYLEKEQCFVIQKQELPDHKRLEVISVDILSKLVIFLIRMKLHLRKGEQFQFNNQKTNAVYWFTEGTLMKMEHGLRYESSVSLNWLLSKDCKIRTPHVVKIADGFWR